MGDKEAKTNKGDDNFGRDSLTDRTHLQGLAEDLCHRLALIRENIVLKAGGDSSRVTDINTCLFQAISMVRSGRNGDKSISTFFDPDLPAVKADGRDLVLMFLIYLSMSKSCTAHVTDRTIHCATAKEKDHVVVRISHNGYIQRQDDLKAVFGKPLQSYFAEAGSVRPSETLLRYAGCLLNKHRVKMKLTNIPGHFELCFNIPTRKSGKNKT
jgi:hypothetical protein